MAYATMASGTIVPLSNALYLDAFTYSLSDGESIELLGPAPAGDNNPGDISLVNYTLGVTNESYYSDIVDWHPVTNGSDELYTGDYYESGANFRFGINENRYDGVINLFDYVLEDGAISNAFINNSLVTLGDIISDFFQANDITSLPSFGLSATDLYSSIIDSTSLQTQFVEAIIYGEGGDDPVQLQWSLSAGAMISIDNAYDVNFVDLGSSGTEVDFDNDLNTQIIDGSIIYNQNAAGNASTFSSNISRSYSSIEDITIPFAKELRGSGKTTPPVFTLGSIDTDTFYNLGDGTTIFAGSSNLELVVGANGTLYFNDPYNDGIALPPGFVTNPGLGTLTGEMGNGDLVIVNADNATYTATIANQVIIGAGNSDTLLAGANNVTLVSIDSSGTNIFGSLDSSQSSYSNLTEIAADAGTNSNNIFVANSETNVLIGGTGNNTFYGGGDGTNIIWGGGGTSTYYVGGTVDIIYTNGTPTTQEIENLTSSELAATLPTEVHTNASDFDYRVYPGITYIIDPSKNDVFGTYRIGNYDTNYSGIYTPAGYEFVPEGTNGPLETNSPVDGNLFIGIFGLSGFSSATIFDFITDFVNGDFGITLSGNAPILSSDPSYGDTVDTSNPGNVYSYTQTDVFDINPDPAGTVLTDESDYVPSGSTLYAVTVATGSSLTILPGGVATSIAQSGGSITLNGGTIEVISGFGYVDVEGNTTGTIIAAGNATTTAIFDPNMTGDLTFINSSNISQTVYTGSEGSVTAFGGAGGGFYAGGSAGNNSLIGGTGAVTLLGGGPNDFLQANSSTGPNILLTGSGTETLSGGAASGANTFELNPNADGLVSSAGAGLQTFQLGSAYGASTITGSTANGAFNLYEVLGTPSTAGANYVFTDFSPANGAIFLFNGNEDGPSDASVTGVTGAPGDSSSSLITLSDGTHITLIGLSPSAVNVITASNGVTAIV